MKYRLSVNFSDSDGIPVAGIKVMEIEVPDSLPEFAVRCILGDVLGQSAHVIVQNAEFAKVRRTGG